MSHPRVPPFRARTLRTDSSSWRDVSFALTRRLSATIRIWIARRRRRQELQDLAERGDEHLLKDIGVTSEEALRMAAKRYWQR